MQSIFQYQTWADGGVQWSDRREDALCSAKNDLLMNFQNNHWTAWSFPKSWVGVKYLGDNLLQFLLQFRKHGEFPQQSLHCYYFKSVHVLVICSPLLGLIPPLSGFSTKASNLAAASAKDLSQWSPIVLSQQHLERDSIHPALAVFEF